MRRSALLACLAAACGAPDPIVDPPVTMPPPVMDAPDSGMMITPDAGVLPDAGEMMPSLCPPSGPFGTREGQLLANVTLPDCDGNLHDLHDLCEREASWVYVFAGW